MDDPTATASECDTAQRSPTGGSPRVLCIVGSGIVSQTARHAFDPQVELVPVSSPVRAITQLERGDFVGVFAEEQHFRDNVAIQRFLQQEQILQAIPDGVLLLTSNGRVVWGNGRLREWSGRNDVVGQHLYDVIGCAELAGRPDDPIARAIATGASHATTVPCFHDRFLRIHAAVLDDLSRESSLARHVVVTLHDVTEEELRDQKLEKIHDAGAQLADYTTDDVAELTYEDRVELLKSNILRETRDVLQFDVIEIRLLNTKTNALEPLLEYGMTAEAAQRDLRAELEGNGVTGYVAATGKSYVCGDAAADARYLAGAEEARSSLTVPLRLHDQVIGTFNVESPRLHAFGRSDVLFLEVFARNVAAAVNTLELLAAQNAKTAFASIEAIHSAVAIPVDEILNQSVGLLERYIGHEPDASERLQKILRYARDIKKTIYQVGQSMAPVEARPATSRLELRPKLAGKRILVVDADPDVRLSAHELLERQECQVEGSKDGEEAVSMVKSLDADVKYDAIIADIRLPDMSGHQLMLRMGELMGRVPLILMTGFGYDPGHSIVKARQAGLKYVLYKPFRLDQLLDAVENTV